MFESKRISAQISTAKNFLSSNIPQMDKNTGMVVAGATLTVATLACNQATNLTNPNNAPVAPTFTPTPGDALAQPNLLDEAGKQVASGFTGRNSNPDTQGTGTPTNTPTSTIEVPSITPSATPILEVPTVAPATRTEAPTAIPTLETSSTEQQLEAMGIEVDFNGLAANWPKTGSEAANLLELDPSYAEHLVPVIWTNTDTGRQTWSGEWMGEMWPLKAGVNYDAAKGIHTDSNGNPLTDIQQIFDFNQRPTLVDITLNADFAAIYAGRGEETTGNLPKYTGYFAGEKGAKVEQIEQLTILRPEFDLGCDKTDFSTAANLRAFRQSVREFRDNEGARNGKRQIEWFNPKTNAFEIVQGQLVAVMANQGIEMPFIDKMPAGYPITGKQVASQLGGFESQWIFDPISGDWNYEAWDFVPGVHYISGVGHFDAQGNILVGKERVDSGSPLSAFDFKKAVNPNLMFSSMKAPGDLPASLWVRVGGDDTATIHPQSIYTSGNGDVTVDPNASMLKQAEQAKLVIVDQNSCAPLEGPDAMTRFAEQLAQDEKANHPGFIVTFWNAVLGAFQTVSGN